MDAVDRPDEHPDEDPRQRGEASPSENEDAPPVAAAWIDEDDAARVIDLSGTDKGKSRLKKLRTSRSQQTLDGGKYAETLRKQFQGVQPDVSWAALPPPKKERTAGARGKRVADGERIGVEDMVSEEDEGEETAEVLRSSGALLCAPSSALPFGALSVKRMVDLNQQERNQSTTSCLQWHPNGKLALTAGPDKTLRLFRTDGADNPRLQSVHLPQLPIESACFTSDGSQIVMCGRGRQWSAFDLNSGTVQAMPGF